MRWPLLLPVLLLPTFCQDLHLTTDDEGYLTVIQGFATQLQCVLNTCSPNVVWYKDDLLLFNGTKLVNSSASEGGAYKLQHKIDINYDKGCSGSCSDSEPCATGQACVDNQCCACSREDFTLVLKNLTFEDSGRYRCQIANQPESATQSSELLEFQVEVLESGLRGGFHENITYDYSECCQGKGISETCRAMCKPSEMAEHHFDPTSCKTDDYKNFLTCATQNNTRNHVHCCKTQLVPSFCYDFCSGDFQMLRRSHRLCLYYLPEIFECYNRAYLPYPDPPESLQVNAIDHDKLSICWQPPPVHDSNAKYPVTSYTVSFKEIPNFPLFGGEMGIPLLTGDYSDVADVEDSDYDEDPHHSIDRRSVEEDLPVVPGGTPEAEELDERVQVRRKRDSIVVITRDSETNTTAVREFAFQHVNTTNTCHTLTDLRAATRYVIVVTARNSFGASVPSVRALASTNVYQVKSNGTQPNSMECCKTNEVSDSCAQKMCHPHNTPNSMETISISTSCRNEWPKVAPCIADQRNHTECCKRKHVQSDCLPICAGSTEPLGVHSVLCLNLDINAIYQCIREGYESHPSPPVNVSVHEVTESTAEIRWAEPSVNAHLVQTYTLFIRKTEHGAPVKQVHNAVSPHTELGLEPDSQYSVSVQSNSASGASLPSTAILFTTKPFVYSICPLGEPLLLSEGQPFVCSPLNPCPSGFRCIEEGQEPQCCQMDGFNSDEDFQECCKAQGVSEECTQHCYFNATRLPESCKKELNRWVQCASQGQDHSRCCEQEKVPEQCLTGCRHPFQVPDSCIDSTTELFTCFAARSGSIPRAPKNVRVSLIRSNSATLSWEELDYDVVTFMVELFKNGSLISTTNTTVDVLKLDNLTPLTTYVARVIGFNEAGSGPPSWNVTFATLPEKDSEGDRPRQPEGVKIAWNHGVKVNITWEPVTVRRDGENLDGQPSYHLYYTEAEKASTQLTTISSKTNWAVMPDLRRDALYTVYVTAELNKRESRGSSVITLIAQQDDYGLPEPQIIFTPDNPSGIFNSGEKININCTLGEVSNKTRHFNMDLRNGPHEVQNDHGKFWVAIDLTADSSLDTASCAVTDTDGRQTVAMKHMLVKFGPVATMNKSRVAAFDDHSVDIVCIVIGFPAPSITFEKDKKSITNGKTVKLIAHNTYKAILHIPKASGNEGMYDCVATSEDSVSRATTEVVLAKERLPVNPRFYLECCEKEHIEGECLQACTIGKVPDTAKNCSQYGPQLLKCAEDIRDHSDCCAAALVPRQCLPLCSGDVPGRTTECSQYAVQIMSCFVKGHEGSPQAVKGVKYEVVSKGKIKVKWDGLSQEMPDNYEYYVVYYRRKGADDDDFHTEKTLANSVEIPVEQGSSYDVAVLAANAIGHSPLVFLDVPGSEIEALTGGKSSHTWLYAFLILFLCGVVVVNLYVFGRRRQLPPPLGKLFGTREIPNDHTVAFENPAYVAGNEVEIRGLGRPEWQNQELQASSNDESGEYRNGMRYSKLETA